MRILIGVLIMLAGLIAAIISTLKSMTKADFWRSGAERLRAFSEVVQGPQPGSAQPDKRHPGNDQTGAVATGEYTNIPTTHGQPRSLPLVSEIEEEIKQLHSKVHYLDSTCRESESRAEMLEIRLQEMGQLEIKIKEREDEITRLHGKMHDIGTTLRAFQERAGLIDLKELEIDQLNGKLEKLEVALQDREARLVKLEGREQDITRLEMDIEARDEEITSLHGKLHVLGAELRASEHRVESLEKSELVIEELTA